jgi:hypothetical protein
LGAAGGTRRGGGGFVDGFADLVGRRRQVLDDAFDDGGGVALGHVLEAVDGLLDLGADGGVDLSAMLFEHLAGGVDELVGLVAEVDELLLGLIVGGVFASSRKVRCRTQTARVERSPIDSTPSNSRTHIIAFVIVTYYYTNTY